MPPPEVLEAASKPRNGDSADTRLGEFNASWLPAGAPKSTLSGPSILGRFEASRRPRQRPPADLKLPFETTSYGPSLYPIRCLYFVSHHASDSRNFSRAIRR